MDRKELKQAGKNLFQKNYWYSVLVAFLMAFTGTGNTPSFNFSFNVNTETNSDNPFGVNNFETILEAFKDSFEGIVETPFFIIMIATILSVVAMSCVLAYFIFASFRCGGIRYFLKARKNQPAEIKEVFENLRDKTNFNIAKVTFSRDISIFLWMLVFFIPGIIKSYEYWAIDYILAVRPDINKDEAKRLSKILMDGNKWNVFELSISFLGWDLLTIFTMGLLNIFYVNPYKQATFVEFFSEIRLQALAKGTITLNDIPDYEFIDPQTQYQGQYYSQPKNVVYRPNGMPMGNAVYTKQPFTPPTYQQSWNNPYAPQNTPIENNFNAPQQPIQEPIQQPIAQPTEPVVEEPVVETPIAEPVAEETVAEPIIETTEPIEQTDVQENNLE